MADNIKGAEGKVTLPGVGALIGEIYQWQLYREGAGADFTLKAAMNQTFYETLWEEAGDDRRVELHMLGDKWYEARPNPDAKVTRNGRQFTIKTVTIHQI
jgi:hypothetical protein